MLFLRSLIHQFEGASFSSSSSSSTHGASPSPSASPTLSPNLVKAATPAAPFSCSFSLSQPTTRASNTPSSNLDEATAFLTSTMPSLYFSLPHAPSSDAAPPLPLQAEHSLLCLPPPSPLATHATTPPTAPEPSQHQPSASRTTNDAPDPPRRRSHRHPPWHSVHPSNALVSSSHTIDAFNHAASSASAESCHDQ
ncbi:hypothetical protein V6Z11_A10G189900 [Gossypium hirsutum]